ncbi:Condensation domain-containing protein [Amycolatopsis xylanica]|uniref:Condensation domain-containing protein n=1 Tax=Amycolatopsis xylanica TaxID=589385 RepID=A0A1H2W6F1_9PSEU|nr:condensation domain-containing protein [Amycolatopsis xylanica]SDW76105.1 Condensation domain-containing protein [Amycolatopsis xylanica]
MPEAAQDQLDHWEPCYLGLVGSRPVTPEQARTLDDGRTVQAAFELDGLLDQNRLRAACQRLLDRNEVLRSCFPDPDMRLVVAGVAVPWRTTYLTTSDERVRRAELDKVLAGERARGFDTARPPLLRAHLLRFRPRRHTLVLSAHRAVADGESVPTLFAEVFQLYGGEAEVRAVEVHELTTSAPGRCTPRPTAAPG